MGESYDVIQKSWQVVPGAPSCDVFMPEDKKVRAAHEEDGSFLFIPGLCSVKGDYMDMGKRISATSGLTVFSPNCNEALPGSRPKGALERRAEVILESMDRWGDNGTRLVLHSLGGPVTRVVLEELGLLKDVPEDSEDEVDDGGILSISYMQPAGFSDHSDTGIFSGARFFLGEALPRAGRLMPSMVRGSRHSHERFDAGKRRAEVEALQNLPAGFVLEAVKAAHKRGIPQGFFLGPKDRLTPAGPIREAVKPIVGAENVIDIHPKAGHLTSQTHPGHMSRLILGHLNLGSRGADVLDMTARLAERQQLHEGYPTAVAGG